MRTVFNWLFGRKRAVRFRWRIGPVVVFLPPQTKEDVEMSLVLTDNQKVLLSVQPVDAKGNPARVDGAPVWSVMGPEVVTLKVAEDGLSCEAMATGELGTTQIQVSADADLGEGVRTIIGILDVEVLGGEAVSLNIVAGAPEEQ